MTYELYRSGILRRGWRWRLVAGNGRIIANGGEAYNNRKDCLHGISLVKASGDAQIEGLTQ